MYAGANTQRAQKRIFTCRKREKEVSLSLSLSFSSVCVVVVVVRTHRAWCVLKAKKRKKKTTIRKNFFFFTHAKRHKIYCTVLDFFSLSRSRSLRSSSSSSRATTPREREREREVRASLQKRSSSLVSRNILVCALSLFFRCCSEYFLFFFFMQRKWIKKSGLWSFFRFFAGIF